MDPCFHLVHEFRRGNLPFEALFWNRNRISDVASEILSSTANHRIRSAANLDNDEENALEIRISLKMLEEQSETILHGLYEKLDPNTNSLIVTFLREDGTQIDGIDEGGPTRTLLNKLFEGLIQHSSLTFKEETGGVLPVVIHNDELKSYQAIGRLMRLCLDNEDYLIGSHFDQSFFDAIASNKNSILDIYKALQLNDKNIVKMFEFLEASELTDEATLYAYPEGNQPEKVTLALVKVRICKTLINYANTDKTIPAIVWIAKELNTQKDGATLKKAIQGEISKELLKELIDCASEIDDYFMTWIDEVGADWIEKFVEVTTGSKTLGKKDINIICNQEAESAFPTFHTCGQLVIVPIYPNYPHFKAQLETALNQALEEGGYQIA